MNRKTAKSTSDEATEWLARLRATDVTEAERGEFAVWLSQGDNKNEFDTTLDLWEHLEVLGTLDVAIPRRSAPHRWVPLAAAASLILGLLVTVAYRNLGDTYTTTTGEQRSVALADGSTIYLNTDSSATVKLGDKNRHVELANGEAYFNVSADVQRPFVVKTEHAEVTVVGTAFAVHTMGALTKVSVTEGSVTVQGDSQKAISLSPGHQALISDSSTRVTVIEAESIATWRSGQLIYKNVTLAEILDDLSRYLPVKIVVHDDTLARQRCPVTSVLQLEDRENMLEALSMACPIRLKALSDNVILIQPAS